MKTVAYIVDNATLQSSPPKEAYEANPCPADATQCLVYVHWDNPNWEAEFEALPGVTWLGFPWDTPPADVASLLASFQTDVSLTRSASLPSTLDTPPPESLASLLRKAGPTGRLIA